MAQQGARFAQGAPTGPNPFDKYVPRPADVEEQEPPPKPPSSANPFDALIEDDRNRLEIRMRDARMQASETTPDARAEALRLGQQSGMPASMVEQDLAGARQSRDVFGHPYQQIIRQAPALAEWSTDADNAAVSKDDTENLGYLEWIWKTPTRAFTRQINGMRYAELRFTEMLRPLTQAERDLKNSYQFHAKAPGMDVEPDPYSGLSAFWHGALGGAGRQLANLTEPGKYGAVGGLAGLIIGGSGGAFVGGPAGIVPGALATARYTTRAGVLYGMMKSVGMQEAAGAYDDFLITTDETGRKIDPDVARVAALTVGAMNGALEKFSLDAWLKRFPGLDKLVKQGAARSAMKQALKNPTIRSALLRLGKKYAGGVSAEVATEVAQRGITIVGEEMSKIATGVVTPERGPKPRSFTEIGTELVREAVAAVPEFALGMAPGPVLGFTRDIERANMAEESVAFFNALAEGAAQQKTGTRVPAALQTLAEDATKNGPITDVYAPLATWRQYWDQQQIDPEQMATSVTGSADAWAHAQTTKTLRIPIARYTTQLAGTEHAAFFTQELKLGDPDAMNGRELEEFKLKVEELKKKITADIQARKDTPAEQAQELVRQTIEAQLVERGGVPRGTARTMSDALLGLGEIARRAGQDPTRVFQRLGLNIEPRQAPEAQGAAGETIAQGAAVAPTSEPVPGLAAVEPSAPALQPPAPTLDVTAESDPVAAQAEAEKQEGMDARGEQFVVYDRAGRRRTLLGPDRASYVPHDGETYGIESALGFTSLADNGGRRPSSDGVQSKLAQDISGILNQHSRMPPVPTGVRVDGEPGQANAAGVHAFFVGYQQGMGSIPTMALYNIVGGENDGSTVDRETLEAQGVPVPPTPPLLEYHQRAIATTPAMRAWFGNSAVVDEESQPLMVYHGTVQTFTTFDRERANPESDFGAGFYFSNNPDDTSENYAGIGPDLANKIERRKEEIEQELVDETVGFELLDETQRNALEAQAAQQARAELVAQEGMIIPVFLKIERPFVVGGPTETRLDYELVEDPTTGDFIDERGPLVDFVFALRDIAAEFHDGDVETLISSLLERESVTASEIYELAAKDEKFSYFTDDNGLLVSKEILRQAIEHVGFDGIIDHTVDLKFGSQRRVGRAMAGMTEDTVHYVAFHATQVKSAISNRGTFDPLDPNMLFQESAEPAPAANAFYSRLTRAVELMKNNVATGAQWKGQIRNAKTGINKDEFAIAKVEDLEDGTRYSKEEVLAYIDQNRPRVHVTFIRKKKERSDDDDIEIDEDELQERADEIADEMRNEAESDFDDWDDLIGKADFIEEDIEEEVERVDANGELELDEDGYTVHETVTRTVYYPAITGGYKRKRDRQTGRLQWWLEYRSGTDIIEDADSYETEEEAERAAQEYLDNDLDREPYYEKLSEMVSESIDYDEARRQARRELEERAREQQEEEEQTEPGEEGEFGQRYQTYSLSPEPEAGTYREAFLTADLIEKPEGYELPQNDVAKMMFRVPYEFLKDHEKRAVDTMVRNVAQPGTFDWKDGHGEYNDIERPIVRIRMDVRRSISSEVPPDLPPETRAQLEADVKAMETAVEQRTRFQNELYQTPTEDPRYEQLKALLREQQAIVDRGLISEAELKPTVTLGDRYLFIEEVQPPKGNEQPNMAPIFLKNWRELAFKWLLRYAAENNLAGVAWTTGGQQAARYSIAKKVEQITYRKNEDVPANKVIEIKFVSNYSVSKVDLHVNAESMVIDVEGGTPGMAELRGNPLGGVIGEELATEIMGNDSGTIDQQKMRKFGGEGLRKLYDHEFGTIVNKLPHVKKAGAKTTTISFNVDREFEVQEVPPPGEGDAAFTERNRIAAEMHHDPFHALERTNQIDVVAAAMFNDLYDSLDADQQAAVMEAMPAALAAHAKKWIVIDPVHGDVQVSGPFESYQAANTWKYANDQAPNPQPTIVLPPDTRTAILGGDFLFQPSRYQPQTAAERELLQQQVNAIVEREVAAAPGSVADVVLTTTGELHVQRFEGASQIIRALARWADQHNVQMAINVEPPKGLSFRRNDGAEHDPSSVGTWVRPARPPRGAYSPSRRTISLFDGADLTTFLHETGHFYLELMGDLVEELEAAEPGTLTADQQRLRADYATILRHLGVTTRGEIGRAQHEKFVDSFLAYLHTGKAPSVRLREAFARYRAWLRSFYHSLRQLEAPLTKDVTDVFDRMLASDEAIDEARAYSRMEPLFITPETAGVSHERFALYRDALEDQHRRSVERLDQQLQREVTREQSAQWQERKAEVRQDVTADAHKLPVYRAIAAIQRGTHPDGTPLVEGETPVPWKLDRAMLVEQFGKERVKALPKTFIAKATEQGFEPTSIAEIFGFQSADDLLNALQSATNMQRYIVEETDRRMLMEHGSLLLDGTLHEKAEQALSDESRDTVIRDELRMLARLLEQTKAVEKEVQRDERAERNYERRWFEAETRLRIAIAEGRKQVEIDRLELEVSKLKAVARSGPAMIRGALPSQTELRDQARQLIAGTQIKELRPREYWAAARASSQAAVEAAARQDIEGALEAKYSELISLAFYREILRAQEDVAARVKAAKDIGKPTTMAKLMLAGETFHDQIAAVLDRFSFARVSQRALDRRAALHKWVEGQEAVGLAVDLPDELLDEVKRTPYQELTVEELVNVTDGLKHLVHLARFKNRLLTHAKGRRLKAVTNQIVKSIYAHKPVRPEGERDRRAGIERLRLAQGVLASFRKLSNMLYEIDGFVDGGPLWTAVMRPLNKAADVEASMTAAASKAFTTIIEKAYPRKTKRLLYVQAKVPAVNRSLSKMERIVIALNWGNDGGRDRIMRAENWNEQQVQAVLDTLDARDAQLVQDLHAFIGSYWEEIAAKQERITGVRPQRVEARSFRMGGTEVPGGYYPLKYDDRLSARMAAMADLEGLNLAKYASLAHPTTKRGFVKARKESFDKKLRWDFGVMFEHVGDVIHDLSHHEALIDVGRILGSSDVQKALLETHGDITYHAVKNTIRDIAIGQAPARNAFEKALNHSRAGATIVGLGWSLSVAALQWLGYFNSGVRIGWGNLGRGMSRYLGTPKRMNETISWVYEVSPFMANRARTQQREINEIRNAVGVYSGKFSAGLDELLSKVSADKVTQQGIADSYFYFIQKMQQTVDVPTWLGAYDAQINAGHDHETAVALADQAVLESQGGGQTKDLADVQRSPVGKIFTVFFSYFSTTYNLAVDQTKKAVQTKDAASIGRLAVDYMMLFIVPATLGYFIREGLRPGDDDEELTAALVKENLSYLMGMIPGVRELGGVVQGYQYQGPAALRILSTSARAMQQTVQLEFDEALVRSYNELAGLIFHYPAAQVWRTGNGLSALIEGQTENPLVLMTGPEPKR